MKRYRFRLGPVLRVRRQEEDRAQGAVLRACAALAAAHDELTARDRAYASSLTAHGSRPAADFLCQQAHRNALAAAVLAQRRSIEQAGQLLQQARETLTAAAARVGALERLDERQQAAHTARALREDELTVDDLVVARAGRPAA